MTVFRSGTGRMSIVGHAPSAGARLTPASLASTIRQPRTAAQNSATFRGSTASMATTAIRLVIGSSSIIAGV